MATTTSTQICKDTDISYRTLDYWIRFGAISVASPSSGSGSPRYFSDEEAFKLKFISHFYHVLPRLFTIDFVHEVWNGETRMEEFDTHYELELENGILLSVPRI